MVGGSIRGPLLLYTLLVSLGLAIGVASISSFSLVRLARTLSVEQGPGGYSPDPDPVERQRADRVNEIIELVRREIRTILLAAVSLAVVAGVVLSSLIGRLVLRPLKELESVAGGSPDAEGVFASRTETHNEITGVAVTFRRTLRQLDDERKRLVLQNKRLAELQVSLVRSEKLASVGRLAAGVAHEIGNPLAAAIGYFDILKLSLSPEEQKDVLDRCAAALRRIHDTIKKLLAYSRGEDDDEPPRPTPLGPVVRDTLMLLGAHPALHAITVMNRVTDELTVAARPGALSQVLMNVVINAGHALTGRPEPRIEIDQRVADDGRVLVTIRDNGPGVPQALREQVFDPFFTTKAEGEGTGLGLAVSRALMERMGGHLEVGDAPGGGAELTIVLSLARAPDPGPAG